jgi:hypothetical protein
MCALLALSIGFLCFRNHVTIRLTLFSKAWTPQTHVSEKGTNLFLCIVVFVVCHLSSMWERVADTRMKKPKSGVGTGEALNQPPQVPMRATSIEVMFVSCRRVKAHGGVGTEFGAASSAMDI